MKQHITSALSFAFIVAMFFGSSTAIAQNDNIAAVILITKCAAVGKIAPCDSALRILSSAENSDETHYLRASAHYQMFRLEQQSIFETALASMGPTIFSPRRAYQNSEADRITAMKFHADAGIVQLKLVTNKKKIREMLVDLEDGLDEMND